MAHEPRTTRLLLTQRQPKLAQTQPRAAQAGPPLRAMQDAGLDSSSEEGSSLDEPSWVSWFCMLRNHEFFCEVDPAFVQDRFNLYGLKEIVGPLYGEAMTMILGYAPTGDLHGGRTWAQRTMPLSAALWPAAWALRGVAARGARAERRALSVIPRAHPPSH